MSAHDDEALAVLVLDALEASMAACGSVLWLERNRHNYGTAQWLNYFVGAAEDAQRGYDAAKAALRAAGRIK